MQIKVRILCTHRISRQPHCLARTKLCKMSVASLFPQNIAEISSNTFVLCAENRRQWRESFKFRSTNTANVATAYLP